MATKAPVECPLCRTELEGDRNLEDHLVSDHTKQRLARFVVAETEALNAKDVSE
ncbi:hypothetical protein [Haloterrigena salinisoli]|uniref:hypothetical protein n=1 Tax=Haloterrigena salinisoli TaxID=3132747 RepID=UPI0030D0A774